MKYYNVSYDAEKYTYGVNQYLGKQDMLVTSTDVAALNPARVSGCATNHTEAFKSSGSSVATYWGFNKSLWGSYYVPTGALVWCGGANEKDTIYYYMFRSCSSPFCCLL